MPVRASSVCCDIHKPDLRTGRIHYMNGNLSIYAGNNRVAWVTGAGSGIGRSVSTLLAQNGWKVAASSRSLDNLDSLRTQNEEHSVTSIPLDVTDACATHKAVNQIEDDIGGIELAILNAGTFQKTPLSDFSASDMKKIFDVNVFGVANGIQSLLSKSEKLKKIAVMGSLAGYRGLPKAASYSASKAALINFVEAIRPEAAKRGVDIVIVNPGFVKTRLTPTDLPPILGISPERAAKYIFAGIESGELEIAFPKSLGYFMRVARQIPDDLYYKICRRIV